MIAALDGRQNHGVFGIPRHRSRQPVEAAIGENGFFAAQVFDDALLGSSVLADAFHEVEVAIAFDSFLPDEHECFASQKTAYHKQNNDKDEIT